MENQTEKFSTRFSLFKETVKTSNGSIFEITKELAWPIHIVKLYANRFHVLTPENIDTLDNLKTKVDEDVLGAICMISDEIRSDLIDDLKNIQESNNPFDLIDSLVQSKTAKHPLESVSTEYWKLISGYLKDRKIDNFPFNKNAIRFIGSVGRNGGFASQSDKQKSWLIGLMSADKNGFDVIPIFTNDIVKEHELHEDHKIITEYYKCL